MLPKGALDEPLRLESSTGIYRTRFSHRAAARPVASPTRPSHHFGSRDNELRPLPIGRNRPLPGSDMPARCAHRVPGGRRRVSRGEITRQVSSRAAGLAMPEGTATIAATHMRIIAAAYLFTIVGLIATLWIWDHRRAARPCVIQGQAAQNRDSTEAKTPVKNLPRRRS
jgi:hypothetical protein